MGKSASNCIYPASKVSAALSQHQLELSLNLLSYTLSKTDLYLSCKVEDYDESVVRLDREDIRNIVCRSVIPSAF